MVEPISSHLIDGPWVSPISYTITCTVHNAVYSAQCTYSAQCSVTQARPNAISPLLIAPGSTWFSHSRGLRPSHLWSVDHQIRLNHLFRPQTHLKTIWSSDIGNLKWRGGELWSESPRPSQSTMPLVQEDHPIYEHLMCLILTYDEVARPVWNVFLSHYSSIEGIGAESGLLTSSLSSSHALCDCAVCTLPA